MRVSMYVFHLIHPLRQSQSLPTNINNYTVRDVRTKSRYSELALLKTNYPPSSMPVALPTVVCLQIYRHAVMNFILFYLAHHELILGTISRLLILVIDTFMDNVPALDHELSA